MEEQLRISSQLPRPIEPVRYDLPFSDEQVVIMLPMMEPASLALISQDDVMWRLRLKNGDIRRTKIDEDYISQVSGGGLQEMEPIDEQRLAYVQVRRIVVYDLKFGKATRFGVVAELSEYGVRAEWMSRDPLVALVEVKDLAEYRSKNVVRFRLRSSRLEGEEAIPLGQLELGPIPQAYSSSWSAAGGIAAVIREGRLEVFGPELSTPKSDHPLAEAANGLSREGLVLRKVRLHHSKPLAVVALERRQSPEGERNVEQPGIWEINWSTSKVQTRRLAYLPIGDITTDLTLGPFAPSGDWITYWLEESGNQVRIYAQRAAAPGQAPIQLGVLPRTRQIYWTREPTALAAVDWKAWKLLSWRLEEPKRP